MNYRKQKRRQSKPVTKEVKFRFWNGGMEYFFKVIAPITVETYRLKEVFNRELVGVPVSNKASLQQSLNRLSTDITWEIYPVKEEQCQTKE